MTYVAFDSLLPISLATSHGIAPAAWGFLVIINAGLVTFGQLRLTRAVARVLAVAEARGRDAADGLPVPRPSGRRQPSASSLLLMTSS